MSNRSTGNNKAEETQSYRSQHSNNSDTDPSFHNNLLRVSKTDVFKKYEVVEVIGTGSMGTVSTVHIRDGKVGGSAFESKRGLFFRRSRVIPQKDRPKSSQDYMYALKMIKLDRISPTYIEELRNEIEILRSMDHPNIIKAHEVYNYKNQIYVVLELCSGGDLFGRSPYSQRQAARIMAQVLSAINYMHHRNIVHRDLKFENILFEDDSEEAEVKIIDFGLSKKFLGKPDKMTERVGTIYTMAPQVLQGVYSSQADLWSCGVITFMLLSASKPFYHKRKRKMIDLIMRGEVQYTAPVWESIEPQAKDFVSKLLVVDPKIRMTASDALKHEWIEQREQHPDERPSERLLTALDNSLLNYKHTSELKKLALNVIAHKSSTKDILELRKVFDSFDSEKDGVLSFEEFKAALEKMNYPVETIEEIFASIDVNQNGHIMYTEFLAATMEAHGHIEEDRIAEAFDRIDADDTGFITKKNLLDALGADATKEQVNAIVKAADHDGDGRISYQEFLRNFRETTQQITNNIASLHTTTGHSAGTEGTDDDDGEELLGLDAKIPGGRYEMEMMMQAFAR